MPWLPGPRHGGASAKPQGWPLAPPPRVVVTSWTAPTPPCVDEAIYGARGHGENPSKAVTCALHSARTAATPCLANPMRLWLAWAAYVWPHALRTSTLPQTALAQAQPSTVMLTLCNVATQVKQSKDRLLLHLPRSCPVKALLSRVTALRYLTPLPGVTTA